MTYTQLAICAVIAAVIIDLFILKSRLTTRKVFWTSYAIIIFFQLITNWWLTSRNIVMYSEEKIIGWRIASAPAEDLLFGFAMVLSVLNLWVYWGKKGVQRK
jgi:lycopene cyclase domain-containing protein